jgi:hypothetical protein
MPVRRKRRSTRPRKGTKSINLFVVLGVIVLILLLFLVKNFFTHRFWTGNDKLVSAVNLPSGDVAQIIFDPVSDEITTIVIPGDTQVEVARDLGIWKIRSVWNLGKNEGIGGGLLTQTISKSLKFPVYVWADSPAFGFTSPSPVAIIRAALSPYRTNLSFGDKVAIALFALKVKNVNRVEINLDETTFLKKKNLEDGTDGFVVSGLPSPKLYSNFVDDTFSSGTLRVVIKDGTGTVDSAKKVGELIEIMGGKVSAIIKEEGRNDVCDVSSKNVELSHKVALIFGCSEGSEKLPENFDLQIRLDKNFIQYF